MKKSVLPILIVLLLSLTIIVPYAMGQSDVQSDPGQIQSDAEHALPQPEQGSEQAIAEQKQTLSEPNQVLLIVYVYDPCGGCGVGQGCGECTEMARYAAMVVSQLGSLFRDGYVDYRMRNARIPSAEESRIARSKSYGIPEDLRYIWPTVFIGSEESGIYLLGEEMMPYIREMLDRYKDGEDAKTLQQEIMERFYP